MGDVVNDIDRPDVGGVEPKMKAVRDEVAAALAPLMLPYLVVTTDDNIMSSVWIRGSFQPAALWAYGIFHNSPYFLIRLVPNKRYFVAGEDMEIELTSMGSGISKLRRYTGPLNKILPKLIKWVESQPQK